MNLVVPHQTPGFARVAFSAKGLANLREGALGRVAANSALQYDSCQSRLPAITERSNGHCGFVIRLAVAAPADRRAFPRLRRRVLGRTAGSRSRVTATIVRQSFSQLESIRRHFRF